MSHRRIESEHNSDRKVVAIQHALQDHDPFYSGICPMPEHQRFLYYTYGDLHRRIDFSEAGPNKLDALYRACKPAEFGRGGENVFDASYRKAGKMDVNSFAVPLDPHKLGIHDQVAKALLTQSHSTMDMELYKLNVYGTGDFFKAHKDTPRGQNMFGTLIVVFPTAHEGGQFMLRQGKKEWSLDFAKNIASATELSVCFVAIYGDFEHEVLPVTSGHRISVTYNLYHTPIHPGPEPSSILSPFHLRTKQALVELVNDTSKLPNGGYFGFGLVHEYVHTRDDLLGHIQSQLKGSDRALADVCDTLGLRYFLRLFYPDIYPYGGASLLTTRALDVDDTLGSEANAYQYLEQGLEWLTIDEVECVAFGEHQFMQKDRILRPFYKNRVTEVMEITPMKSSVGVRSPIVTYGNEANLEFFYGTACMVIAVEPATSRHVLEV